MNDETVQQTLRSIDRNVRYAAATRGLNPLMILLVSVLFIATGLVAIGSVLDAVMRWL